MVRYTPHLEMDDYPDPNAPYRTAYAPLLSHSPQMRGIRDAIEGTAETTAIVLIRGERGVGKDLLARAIHAASARCHRPFVKVNCAALPAGVLESRLFGHEKGAFAETSRRRLGHVDFANTGTLYLDKMGELPLPLQAQLLHLGQEGTFRRVGGGQRIRVDTRIVATTNGNLQMAPSKGEPREDLDDRRGVIEIEVPPLRERKEEIPTLIEFFLARFNVRYQRTRTVSPEIIARLLDYSWPGNVRELRHIVRCLVVLPKIADANDLLGRAVPRAVYQ